MGLKIRINLGKTLGKVIKGKSPKDIASEAVVDEINRVKNRTKAKLILALQEGGDLETVIDAGFMEVEKIAIKAVDRLL